MLLLRRRGNRRTAPRPDTADPAQIAAWRRWREIRVQQPCPAHETCRPAPRSAAGYRRRRPRHPAPASRSGPVAPGRQEPRALGPRRRRPGAVRRPARLRRCCAIRRRNRCGVTGHLVGCSSLGNTPTRASRLHRGLLQPLDRSPGVPAVADALQPVEVGHNVHHGYTNLRGRPSGSRAPSATRALLLAPGAGAPVPQMGAVALPLPGRDQRPSCSRAAPTCPRDAPSSSATACSCARSPPSGSRALPPRRS